MGAEDLAEWGICGVGLREADRWGFRAAEIGAVKQTRMV
jgi:hypothetical protein